MLDKVEESRVDGDEQHVQMIREVEPELTSPGELQLRIEADRTSVRAGESVTLTLELRNTGGSDLQIPASLRLGDGFVRIRVVDGAWNETTLGVQAGDPVVLAVPTRVLAPGAERTVTLRLTVAEAAFLGKAGTYHLFVDGDPLQASADSNRITIRVTT
jgi:hypothetical protein